MIDYGYCQSELAAGDVYINATDIRKVCQGIKAIGGSRIRIGVLQVGTWDDLDRAVRISAEEGLKPLLCILGNATLGYNGTPASYGTLCKNIALRYGPSGTNTVAEYELFNEMNSSLNPPNTTNTATFVEYLKQGYTGIKSVHTSSTVIAGGTLATGDVPFAIFPWPLPPFFVTGNAIDPVKWYKGIYAAGGKNYMDAVGFHLYTDSWPQPGQFQYDYMGAVRQVMIDNGDSAKKMWVTEVGTALGPAIKTMVEFRDWLKALIDILLAADYVQTFFIYSFRNVSTNTNDINAIFGMVEYDFTPRTPVYEYAKTIAGTPADPGDITPPSAPLSFTVTGIQKQSATASWGPASDDVGVSVYYVYDGSTRIAQTAAVGQTATPVQNLNPGTTYTLHATAVDAAGNESDPSNTFTFTTSPPAGLQSVYTYDFADSPSVPTVFTQLGLGFTVTAGVARPNSAVSDGDVWTVAPYGVNNQSPDHYSEITQNVASTFPDRVAMTGVRLSADGTQGVWAFISGGGQADACKIVTIDNGTITLRDAMSTTPLLPTERLRLTTEGNTYTAYRMGDGGVQTELAGWTDITNTYAGKANIRTGMGWRHKRVHNVNYPPPGIVRWKSFDLTSVNAGGGGGFEAWMLALGHESDWGELISTGLWEATI